MGVAADHRREVDAEGEAAEIGRGVFDPGVRVADARDVGRVQREEMAAAISVVVVEIVAPIGAHPHLRHHGIMGKDVAIVAGHRVDIAQSDGAETALQVDVDMVDRGVVAPVDAVEPDAAAIFQPVIGDVLHVELQPAAGAEIIVPVEAAVAGLVQHRRGLEAEEAGELQLQPGGDRRLRRSRRHGDDARRGANRRGGAGPRSCHRLPPVAGFAPCPALWRVGFRISSTPPLVFSGKPASFSME
jgi:hypothetical protein